MKPSRFHYEQPHTVAAALDLLREHGWEAKLLAGGQSLMPLLNLRLSRPSVLIDINHLHDLAQTSNESGRWVGGALVRESRLESGGCPPLLQKAAAHIGHGAIRHRGTLGGSVAHADPAAELPCAILTLDGEMVVAGVGGERRIPAADFFVSAMTTALEPDEMLVRIEVPDPPVGSVVAFEEIARRQGDFALVGVAAMIAIKAGTISDARLGVAGVADRPLRLDRVEAALQGQPLTAAVAEAAAQMAFETVEATGDMHAPGTLRRQMLQVLIERALGRCQDETTAVDGGLSRE